MVGSDDDGRVEVESAVRVVAAEEEEAAAPGVDFGFVVFFADFLALFLLLLLALLLLALDVLLDDGDVGVVASADVFFPPEARRRAKLAFFSFCLASTAAIFFSCLANLGPRGEPSSCWPTSQSLRASRKWLLLATLAR